MTKLTKPRKRKRTPPKEITVRWVLRSGGMHPGFGVLWCEKESATRLRYRLSGVRLGWARLVLRRKNKAINLDGYDLFVRQLREFCRRYGIPEPRLPRYVQAKLTEMRRAVAVVAKLKGTGVK